MLFFVGVTADGRIVRPWTYQEMFDQADLVVVASVVSTKDTDERTTFRDFRPELDVVGVVTELTTLLALKGGKGITTFQLHHYRLQSEDLRETLADGPDLVRPTGRNQCFLMFLVKEQDGRYSPVGGQTDPGGISVLELNGAAH